MDTSFKHPANTTTSIDITYMTGINTEYKARLEEMSQLNSHYKEMATQKYAQEERLKEETFKREKEESMKKLFEQHPELEKIRNVMGEEEWDENDGHICNDCAHEAGASLRCK